MRVTDLARAMAPDLPHDIIGIRPGEKLHEIMITDDDARLTLELDDRYIICPPQAEWSPGRLYALGATKVSEEFRYSSEINREWLDGAALNKTLRRQAA
jgi:UDP-N-acetylglucosamine 4,6-dehydratase/5-epimerase